jgi:hypothetical protein
MSRTHYKVLPYSGVWQLRREQSPLQNYTLKAQAVDAGQRLAKDNPPSQLTVYKANGQIEFEWTYGNDPYPPKG